MNKNFISVLICAIICCASLTACGGKPETQETPLTAEEEAPKLSDEEVKNIIGMVSTDPAYHNGSQSEREKYIKDLLRKMEDDGNIKGNITQDGTVIWFEYNSGEKQGIDITKDNLWVEQNSSNVNEEYQAEESEISEGDAQVSEVRTALGMLASLPQFIQTDDIYIKAGYAKSVLDGAKSDGYVKSYKQVDNVIEIEYPNGQLDMFNLDTGNIGN